MCCAGQPKFRSMWERYCHGVDAIVFVVDSADPEKFNTARFELHQLLGQPTLNAVPLLVVCSIPLDTWPCLNRILARQQKRLGQPRSRQRSHQGSATRQDHRQTCIMLFSNVTKRTTYCC
ncbi:unnamed protein product [Mycena citricolor]|uniref:Uncharacterized protein n=1 Tax=Mycena citricolor TaxID=2018698 RepID=A0AAD2H6J7_9AGAR|nr:unnamed protein product [Mycena citricolor]